MPHRVGVRGTAHAVRTFMCVLRVHMHRAPHTRHPYAQTCAHGLLISFAHTLYLRYLAQCGPRSGGDHVFTQTLNT